MKHLLEDEKHRQRHNENIKDWRSFWRKRNPASCPVGNDAARIVQLVTLGSGESPMERQKSWCVIGCCGVLTFGNGEHLPYMFPEINGLIIQDCYAWPEYQMYQGSHPCWNLLVCTASRHVHIAYPMSWHSCCGTRLLKRPFHLSCFALASQRWELWSWMTRGRSRQW